MTLHSVFIGAAIDEVLFGVAAINVRNMSSGIRWQEECRYFKDEVIPIVGSVRLMPDPPRNSLTLTWKPVECEPGSKNVYINQYQIFYCQLVESGNNCALVLEQKMNVSASNVVPVTLRNLNHKIRYGISIRAVSLTKMGPISIMVEGQPHNDEQKTTFSLPFCRKPNLEPLTSLPMQNNVISEVNNCKGKYDKTL
uniref:Uncharacterized protein LOC111130212 n=1 Tax=Crassostrea virginica TaxID=6565 RepID=A0A8B8DXN9_CRAVI|nr:uncharacterized protein LOC111130212 [Crassostrea virginica]